VSNGIEAELTLMPSPHPPNPLADVPSGDADDQDLVRRVHQGSREALELLIIRHQPWIYNIALRMIYHPQDAEDITQEILIKLLTTLSTFEGRSRFRTWLYRIVVNHVLNMKRTHSEAWEWTFEKYGSGLARAPDMDLPDPRSVPADVQLLVDEARIGCSSGMLLCLDREQRLDYVLGEIFGVTDVVGAELLEISRDNFRQKLSRARRDLHSFMQDKCGLVNTANPCGCAKKTQAFSLITTMLFQLQTTDARVYAAATACLVFVGVAACIPPVVRALRIQPETALRYE